MTDHDVWDDDADSTELTLDERQRQRDAQRIAKSVYSDAVVESRTTALQQAFNTGFSRARTSGMEWGMLQGRVCTLLMHYTKTISHEDLRIVALQQIFEELYEMDAEQASNNAEATLAVDPTIQTDSLLNSLDSRRLELQQQVEMIVHQLQQEQQHR